LCGHDQFAVLFNLVLAIRKQNKRMRDDLKPEALW
jgi:hypothetical protein